MTDNGQVFFKLYFESNLWNLLRKAKYVLLVDDAKNYVQMYLLPILSFPDVDQ